MIRLYLSILPLLVCYGCAAQPVRQTTPLPATTLGEIAPYPPLRYLPIKRLIYADGAYRQLKPRYQHLDSIELGRFEYEVGGRRVHGYFASPKNREKTYPAVIYSRAGKYDLGRWTYGSFATQLGWLAARGYVVISYEYGRDENDVSADQFGGTDLSYLLGALAIAPQLPAVDSSRLALMGENRGGMMSLLAMAERPAADIRCAIAIAAPTDWKGMLAARPEFETIFREMIPNFAQERKAALAKRSIFKRVGELTSELPILLLHGTADTRVPVTQSQQLSLALTKAGYPHELKLFPGGDHVLGGFEVEWRTAVSEWLEKYTSRY